MGTYTANKELFMPTVGEQGWGTLVNGNFETIDNFLKPISLSGSTYTFTGNHVGNQSGGSISATSISNSGTLTQTGTSTFTGKITANGGIGTKALTATSISNSGTLTQTSTSTFTGKITANGGIGTTSLTTSSTITSTGLITANGGIKGTLTGNVTGYLIAPVTAAPSGNVVMISVGASGNKSMSRNETVTLVTFNASPEIAKNILSFGVKNGDFVTGGTIKITVNVSMSRGNCMGNLLLNGVSIGSVYKGSDEGLSTSVTLTGGPIKAGANTISYQNTNSSYGGTVSLNAFNIYYGVI